MIILAPAPKQPQVSPLGWTGDPAQCPQWVGFPTRAGLPAGLSWSGSGEVPTIGARVHIYMNSYGPAEVLAYFHTEDYLGVICQPDTMPARLATHGVTQGHFLGRELEFYRPGPHAPAMIPEVIKIAPVSTDWIPDYPPQEGDELPVNNQDSEEHTQDKQRD